MLDRGYRVGVRRVLRGSSARTLAVRSRRQISPSDLAVDLTERPAQPQRKGAPFEGAPVVGAGVRLARLEIRPVRNRRVGRRRRIDRDLRRDRVRPKVGRRGCRVPRPKRHGLLRRNRSAAIGALRGTDGRPAGRGGLRGRDWSGDGRHVGKQAKAYRSLRPTREGRRKIASDSAQFHPADAAEAPRMA